MIILRHLCKNVTFVGPVRWFSISRLNTRNWTKRNEWGRRGMSVQQEKSEESREVNDADQIRNTSIERKMQEESGDWFENRYLDKSYHARDGLNPDEWLLLYRITDEEHRNRIDYSLCAIAFGAIACGTFLFVMTCIRQDDNPFRIAPAFILGGFMCAMYATRLRRYGIIRLYGRRYEQEEWERWRFEQLLLPANLRDAKSPMRHYCLVTSDILHRHHVTAYNSRQVSDWVNRKSWLSRAMNGNFLVLGRPYALHPEFFEESPDYIFVRRP